MCNICDIREAICLSIDDVKFRISQYIHAQRVGSIEEQKEARQKAEKALSNTFDLLDALDRLVKDEDQSFLH